MERREEPGEDAREDGSLWEELAEEPLMEPTEAITIKRGFFKTLFGSLYENLGSLILLNLAVTLQLGAGLGIALLLAALVGASSVVFLVLLLCFGVLFLAPALAGLFAYARAACDPDMLTSLGEYVRGMRRYARRSWILLAIQVAVGVVIWINLRFYTSEHNLLGLVLTFVILVLALVWIMAGMYAWPLLVRDLDWRLLGRNAVFLALAAPFSTIAILLGLGVVSTLLIYTRVLWAIALFSVWAVTENVALVRLVRAFQERQAEQAAERDGDAEG